MSRRTSRRATDPAGNPSSDWRKVSDWPSHKMYEHSSGLVRVHRHRKTHSHTVRDGWMAVGRTSYSTSWSQISVHSKLLLALGTVTSAEAARLLRDEWSNVEGLTLSGSVITHLSLREAEAFAERILDGSQRLVAHQIDYGPPLNKSEVHVGVPGAFR